MWKARGEVYLGARIDHSVDLASRLEVLCSVVIRIACSCTCACFRSGSRKALNFISRCQGISLTYFFGPFPPIILRHTFCLSLLWLHALSCGP